MATDKSGPNPQRKPPTEEQTVRGGLAVDQNLPGVDQDFHYPGGEAQYNADHADDAAGAPATEQSVRSVEPSGEQKGNTV